MITNKIRLILINLISLMILSGLMIGPIIVGSRTYADEDQIKQKSQKIVEEKQSNEILKKSCTFKQKQLKQ